MLNFQTFLQSPNNFININPNTNLKNQKCKMPDDLKSTLDPLQKPRSLKIIKHIPSICDQENNVREAVRWKPISQIDLAED